MGQRIAIVDYGMGNLRSVEKALAHVAPAASVAITADPEAIRAADRVVFPGQGAMPDCMKCLAESGLGEAVREAAAAKPFLGLCIGLQMLFERSDEGDTPGLAILPGEVLAFSRAAGDAGGRPQDPPHGLERGLAGASPPPVAGHPGRGPVLFRAQLLLRARRPGAHRGRVPLSARLYLGHCAG